jgi:GT2 family glycosyltransferase
MIVSAAPLITVAVPSFNQGRYLADALESIFHQGLAVEVFVADGGSTDNTLAIIEKWQDRLAWWRSGPDGGQAAAINEAISHGTAPFVCWLNSDDTYFENGLNILLSFLQSHPKVPFVYGRTWNTDERGKPTKPYWTGKFSEWNLAQRCLISQPATLIRREAWEAVGGLDESLQFSMDYDLWWKILRRSGPPVFVPEFVATNRIHEQSKTSSQRCRHYAESVAVVKKYAGGVPLKWRLAWPWSVWFRSKINKQQA